MGGNEDLVHALDSCADRLMMNPSWNSWFKEMDISVNLKEEITRCICSMPDLELSWRYYPWEHKENKDIADGLEDIRLMIHNIKSLDVEVSRDPIKDQTHDPK